MAKKVNCLGMKRIGIEAPDPIFGAGSPHTYIAPIAVSPSGIDCEAELYLGPDEATKTVTSGLVPFTSTGLSQNVRLPINMPVAVGIAYHGYINVYAEGMLIGGYYLLADIIIPSVEIGPGTWE